MGRLFGLTRRMLCVFILIEAICGTIYLSSSNYLCGSLMDFMRYSSESGETGLAVSLVMLLFMFPWAVSGAIALEVILICKIAKGKSLTLEKYAAGACGGMLLLLLVNGKYFNLFFKMIMAEIYGTSYGTGRDYGELLEFAMSGGFGSNVFLVVSIILNIAVIAAVIVCLYRIKAFGFVFPDEQELSKGEETLFSKNDLIIAVQQAKEEKAEAKVMARKSMEKIKALPKGKKAGIAGGIIAVIVLIGGLVVYNTFFNYDEIDLMENLSEPTFYGFDGAGSVSDYPSQGTIDYDMTKPGYADFVNSVTYSLDKTEGLSNGDEITVTVEYSRETAKSLKIKVKNDTKKIKVSGLTERFKDGNDIDEKDLKLIKKAMNLKAEEATESEYGYKDEEYTCKRIALMFAKDKAKETGGYFFNDKIFGIYQTVCDGDTKYFTVEADAPIYNNTDIENLTYSDSYFEDHFVNCMDEYLGDSQIYDLTEIGASKKKAKTVEDWYSSSFASIARVVYPATRYPSMRADYWEVIVKDDIVTYEYSYDTKLDKDSLADVKEMISENMEGEDVNFERVVSMIQEYSEIKDVTLKVRFIDGKNTLLFSEVYTAK